MNNMTGRFNMHLWFFTVMSTPASRIYTVGVLLWSTTQCPSILDCHCPPPVPHSTKNPPKGACVSIDLSCLSHIFFPQSQTIHPITKSWPHHSSPSQSGTLTAFLLPSHPNQLCHPFATLSCCQPTGFLTIAAPTTAQTSPDLLSHKTPSSLDAQPLHTGIHNISSTIVHPKNWITCVTLTQSQRIH